MNNKVIGQTEINFDNREETMKKYRVRRTSTGYIVEEAIIEATSLDEAYNKLADDELDSDFEIVRDEMSVEDEDITEIKQKEQA
jgi:hypothetical protein